MSAPVDARSCTDAATRCLVAYETARGADHGAEREDRSVKERILRNGLQDGLVIVMQKILGDLAGDEGACRR